MAEPPSNGALKATTTAADRADTVGALGASGIAFGIAVVDAADVALSPLTFDANTVHVYVLPFVNADTLIGDDAPVALPAAPPSDDKHPAV